MCLTELGVIWVFVYSECCDESIKIRGKLTYVNQLDFCCCCKWQKLPERKQAFFEDLA